MFRMQWFYSQIRARNLLRFAILSKTPNKKGFSFNHTLPETNMAFERKVVSQPSFSRGFVSFREGAFPAKVESFDIVGIWLV